MDALLKEIQTGFEAIVDLARAQAAKIAAIEHDLGDMRGDVARVRTDVDALKLRIRELHGP